MSLKDIKIPADASDKQTTDARSAVPPTDFSATLGGGFNLISIKDRQGPQDRLPTVAYRVYFLPSAFAPEPTGSTATVGMSVVSRPAARQAAQRVATLVTEMKAPGFGTILTYNDTANFGKTGYYCCVAVNRSGVEAPVEQMVKAP